MSSKVGAQQQAATVQNPIFDDFEDDAPSFSKVDQAQVKDKVVGILHKPCAVNSKELVHRATFGKADPFDAFDPIEFLSKIKK